ncbi:MAG: BrnT family toxin [Actinomycetota bacterium]|nr:BrnT family toxin [Actinomycetota bacterium]
MNLRFEFDAVKSKRNKFKHGIDFVEAQELWEDDNLIASVTDFEGEVRFTVIGVADSRHWTAVITYRHAAVRIISVRRARRQEVEAYEAQAHHG